MNLIEWKGEAERLAIMYGVACASHDASEISRAYSEMIVHLKTNPEEGGSTRRDLTNRQIRDLVDGLLAQSGYQPESSVRNHLSMMSFCDKGSS